MLWIFATNKDVYIYGDRNRACDQALAVVMKYINT